MKYNLGTLFSKICKKNLNKKALILKNKEYTYEFFDINSNLISGYFNNTLKLKTQDVVAIEATKSLESYLFLLSCLKIGVSYVFIDPDSPNERIKKIFKTIKPKIFFINKIKYKANSLKKVKILNIKKVHNLSKMKKYLLNNKIFNFSSDKIAYIMFTSGSTGDPKGASITHDNLINFIKWTQTEYKIKTNDNITNLNPLHFDNSVFDIYSSFFNGATLVPFEKKEIIDTKSLITSIIKNKISIWFSVPSLLVFILNFKSFSTSSFIYLKKIIFGGEGFPKSKLKELYKLTRKKKVELHNVYGPTECTCICSSYKINKNDFKKNEMKRFAPFGKKMIKNFYYFIDNKKNYKGQDIGELILGGPNVGKGYYNNKKETKKRFIKNFKNTKNKKDIVYRTGDLVYVDKKNRNIYFSNRADDQIKYLGHRIELGEIQQNLNKIKEIKECYVEFRKKNLNSSGEILCWLSHSSNLSLIRDKILKLLPKYMMPSRFIELKILPKNSNGKIDRNNLKKRSI